MVCVGSVPTWTVKSWLHRGTARLRRGECLHAVTHSGSSRVRQVRHPHEPGFVHALAHGPWLRFVRMTDPGSCMYLCMNPGRGSSLSRTLVRVRICAWLTCIHRISSCCICHSPYMFIRLHVITTSIRLRVTTTSPPNKCHDLMTRWKSRNC